MKLQTSKQMDPPPKPLYLHGPLIVFAATVAALFLLSKLHTK